MTKYVAHYLDHSLIWAVIYTENGIPTGQEFRWGGSFWSPAPGRSWALDKLWIDPDYEEIILPADVPPLLLDVTPKVA